MNTVCWYLFNNSKLASVRLPSKLVDVVAFRIAFKVSTSVPLKVILVFIVSDCFGLENKVFRIVLAFNENYSTSKFEVLPNARYAFIPYLKHHLPDFIRVGSSNFVNAKAVCW